MDIIRKLKEILKKYNPDYEEVLSKKFTQADNFMGEIKILFISDTHGDLALNKKLQTKLRKAKFDVCCILGDIHDYDYKFILDNIDKESIVGLLGNHDRKTLLSEYNIFDLNGNIIEINGIKIGGIQGSHKYKDEDYPSYTHKESINLLDKLKKVDILISHDKPLLYDYNDSVHDGLRGITYYLYKNRVPYNIHGHLHKSDDTILKNGTKSIGVYQCEVITFKDDKFFREN